MGTLVALHSGRTPVFVAVGWPLVGKTSTICQPTRPTKHFILSGSINWVVSWSRCVPPWSGDAIWWMLTKLMQDGLFNSWINVCAAGKTVWTPCHLARSSRWSLFVGQTAFHFYIYSWNDRWNCRVIILNAPAVKFVVRAVWCLVSYPIL